MVNKFTALDALLQLTDQSNWPNFGSDHERSGYTEAMEAVHDVCMDFWDELNLKDFGQPADDHPV